MATIREAIHGARRRLAQAVNDAPGREARLLLGSLIGMSEASLIARDEELVTESVARRFEALLERRERGEPVAYLIGRREFFGRDFAVDSRV